MTLRIRVFIALLSYGGAVFAQSAFNQQVQPMDPNMLEMMLPPFLRYADTNARREFETIVTNRDIKKSEITAKLDDWANRQPSQVKV